MSLAPVRFSTVGTPANTSLSPNSPSSSVDTGMIRFSSYMMALMMLTQVVAMP